MFDANIWHWLIAGLQDVMDIVFLNGIPFHYDWGISALFTGNMVKGLLMVFTVVGTFVRLSSLALAVGIVLLMETFRAIYAAYKWVKDLIPIP